MSRNTKWERCRTCNTEYNSDGACPLCHGIEQQRKIAEEHEQAETQRHEKQLEQQNALAELTFEIHQQQARHQQELADQERADREAAEERMREAMEADSAQRMDIAKNAWRFEADSKRRRGDQLLAAGLFTDALFFYKHAAALDPSVLALWHQVARAYAAIGNDNERRQALFTEVGLLRLPEHMDDIGGWKYILASYQPDDNDLREEFHDAIEALAARTRSGRGDRLDRWIEIEDLYTAFGDAAGRRSALCEQVRLLRASSRLADFSTIAGRLPRDDRDLMERFAQTLRGAEGIDLLSQFSSLFSLGNFPQEVLALAQGQCARKPDLSSYGLLAWASSKAGLSGFDLQLDRLLDQVAVADRHKVLQDYRTAQSWFNGPASRFEKEALALSALTAGVRKRFLNWLPDLQQALRLEAAREVQANRGLPQGSWTIALAIVAIIGTIMLPAQFWLAAFVLLASGLVAFHYFLREATREMREAAGFAQARQRELSQWQDILGSGAAQAERQLLHNHVGSTPKQIKSLAAAGLSALVLVGTLPGVYERFSTQIGEAAASQTAQPVFDRRSDSANNNGIAPQTAQQIRAVLDQWVATTRSGDATGHLALYNNPVTVFYSKRNLTKTDISNESSSIYHTYSGFPVVNLSALSWHQLSPTLVQLQFDKDFVATKWKGGSYQGKVQSELSFKLTNAGWKIVEERDIKVYWTNHRGADAGLAAVPGAPSLTGTWTGGFDCRGTPYAITLKFYQDGAKPVARVVVPGIGEALYRVNSSASKFTAIPERELVRIKPTTWLNIQGSFDSDAMNGSVSGCGLLTARRNSEVPPTPVVRKSLGADGAPRLDFPVPEPRPSLTQPYQTGGGMSAPKVLFQVQPEYSEDARKAKVEGKVVVSLVVEVDGKPHDIRIVRSLQESLDQKAIEAVEKWRFQPGQKDGKPAATKATIEMEFRLL